MKYLRLIINCHTYRYDNNYADQRYAINTDENLPEADRLIRGRCVSAPQFPLIDR